MSSLTTNMSLGKAVGSDNARDYLKTTLYSALDTIDGHDHSTTAKGLPVGRVQTATTPAVAGAVQATGDAFKWWGATAGAVRTAVDLESAQTIAGAKTFSAAAVFSSTINGQTISATASFTGTLTTAGALTVNATGSVFSAGANSATTLTVGGGGTASSTNAHLFLNAPSTGGTGSAQVLYQRAGTSIWQTGIDGPTGGAKAAATDFFFYNNATGSYIIAFSAAGAGRFTAGVLPASSDGAALGSTSLMWSDLFLASGAVINFNNGDVTITHSADGLSFAGAVNNGYSFDDIVKAHASSIFTASFRAPHGSAPSSPVDGDMWTTTAGLFVRINGVTKSVNLT